MCKLRYQPWLDEWETRCVGSNNLSFLNFQGAGVITLGKVSCQHEDQSLTPWNPLWKDKQEQNWAHWHVIIISEPSDRQRRTDPWGCLPGLLAYAMSSRMGRDPASKNYCGLLLRNDSQSCPLANTCNGTHIHLHTLTQTCTNTHTYMHIHTHVYTCTHTFQIILMNTNI